MSGRTVASMPTPGLRENTGKEGPALTGVSFDLQDNLQPGTRSGEASATSVGADSGGMYSKQLNSLRRFLHISVYPKRPLRVPPGNPEYSLATPLLLHVN